MKDTLPALNSAVEKLTVNLLDKREELRHCEHRSGKGYPLRKINRLRSEIDSIEKRLVIAERLQESALNHQP